MSITIREATVTDAELLAQTRVAFIIDDMQNESAMTIADTDISILLDRNRDYFNQTLSDNTFMAFLAFDESELVATSGLSFYQVAPSFDCPDGKIAVILNIYTISSHRKLGISTKLVALTLMRAEELGYRKIKLNASHMGRALYEKCGFIGEPDEMVYYPK